MSIHVRSCFGKALKQRTARLAVFGEEPPKKTVEDMDGMLKVARATLLEKQLYGASIKPQLAESARTTEINDVVAKLEAANLTVMDIDASLWGLCQKVVSGEKLI